MWHKHATFVLLNSLSQTIPTRRLYWLLGRRKPLEPINLNSSVLCANKCVKHMLYFTGLFYFGERNIAWWPWENILFVHCTAMCQFRMIRSKHVLKFCQKSCLGSQHCDWITVQSRIKLHYFEYGGAITFISWAVRNTEKHFG